MSAPKKAAEAGKRVYEYLSEDGVVFYSFTLLPHYTNPPKKMYLQSRLGVHLTNFLIRFRRQGDFLSHNHGSDPETEG